MSRYAIAESDWTPAQQTFAERLRVGARGKIGVPFLNLLPIPELARKVAELGSWLRFDGALEPEIRELVTLTVAEFHRCPYEWLGHASLALKAGLDAASLRAVSVGESSEALTRAQCLAIDAARAILRDGRLDDRRFAILSDEFGREGTLELVCLCGYYALLAMVINTGYADGDQPDWEQTVDLTLRTAS